MNINIIITLLGHRFAVGFGVQMAKEDEDEEPEVHELHGVEVRAETERSQPVGFSRREEGE